MAKRTRKPPSQPIITMPGNPHRNLELALNSMVALMPHAIRIDPKEGEHYDSDMNMVVFTDRDVAAVKVTLAKYGDRVVSWMAYTGMPATFNLEIKFDVYIPEALALFQKQPI